MGTPAKLVVDTGTEFIISAQFNGTSLSAAADYKRIIKEEKESCELILEENGVHIILAFTLNERLLMLLLILEPHLKYQNYLVDEAH